MSRNNKPENMTVQEAIEYYADKIERGEPSKDDNIFNNWMRGIYHLGDGDFEKGMERFREREERQREHSMRINPALTFFDELQKSDNPVHRMFAKFILQGGMGLPTKDATELQNKLLQEENYKSAKQIPASAGQKIKDQGEKQPSTDFQREIPDEENSVKRVLVKIEPLEYPDSVEHFRARMERYIAIHGNKWTFPPSPTEYFLRYEKRMQKSTREAWAVHSNSEQDSYGGVSDATHAVILATEEINDNTIVEFLDGIKYYHPDSAPVLHTPIGGDFIAISNQIKEGLAIKTLIIANKLAGDRVKNKRKKEINLQTKPAGRKVNVWNPLVYEILHDGKEDSDLRAFKAWCEYQEIKEPNKQDRDAFKKAMERVRKRRERSM